VLKGTRHRWRRDGKPANAFFSKSERTTTTGLTILCISVVIITIQDENCRWIYQETSATTPQLCSQNTHQFFNCVWLFDLRLYHSVDNSIPFEARFTTTFGGLSNLELPSTKNFHSFLQCNTVLNAMISKAVRFMSTFHGTAHALKRGDMSKMDDVVRSTVFSPQHFPKFLGTTMVFSFFGGFFWMESLKKSRIPAVAASSLRG
jgi:hypothetical protein